ncbi:hypothetical protein WJX75_007472 [Coccomyxa subellipsoidea]|uniref:Uncharacterized protein n=1 Tax=Coccomyxa subellipsoidea TaxID=248742 RepID=A0ABR2Z1E6_9CHLO
MDSDLETVRRALEDFLGKEVAAWFKKSQLVALQTKGFTTRAALELLTDAKMRSLQVNAAQRAAIKKGGRPRVFNNISLIVLPDDPYDIPKIHTLRAVTQKSFERFAYNCGAVAVIISGEMYVPEDVQLEDGLIFTAVKVDQPSIDLGVTTIEGFVSNLVQTFEGTAHDAAQKILFDQHADAERMKFREIKSSSGKKKEIDGGSMSKNCAVIVEAKTKLTAAHVAELCEKRDFILKEDLVGPGAILKDRLCLMKSTPSRAVRRMVGKAADLKSYCLSALPCTAQHLPMTQQNPVSHTSQSISMLSPNAQHLPMTKWTPIKRTSHSISMLPPNAKFMMLRRPGGV